MRKQYFLPAIAGVKKDIHGRGIPEGRCQEAENVLFEHGHVRTRWGYRPISANIPLTGPITNITEFEKIISGEKFLVVCTTRDIYFWNMNRGVFEMITTIIDIESDSVTEGANLVINTDEDIEGYEDYDSLKPYFFRTNYGGVVGPDQEVVGITQNALTVSEAFVWVPYSSYLYPSGETEMGIVMTYNGVTFGVTPFLTRAKIYSDNFNIDVDYILSNPYRRESISPVVLELDEEISGFSGTLHIDYDGAFHCYIDTLTSGDVNDVAPGDWVVFEGLTGDNSQYNGLAFGLVEEVDAGDGIITCIGGMFRYGFGAAYFLWGETYTGSFGIKRYAQSEQQMESGDFYSSVGYFSGSQDDGYAILGELRLCDTGDMDDVHDTAILYDDEEEDNVIAITNGIQDIRVWNGEGNISRLGGDMTITGTVTDDSDTITDCEGDGFSAIKPYMYLSGLGIPAGAYVKSVSINGGTITMSAAAESTHNETPVQAYSYPNKAKYIDFFGSTGAEHVIIAHTTDGTVLNRQTVEMSEAGDIRMWNTIYFDLIDSNDAVAGIKKLQNRMFVYKERSITEMYATPSGGNDNPFDVIQNKVNIGTPSGRTIVEFENYHIFFGWDNIYVFDGITVMGIGDDVMDDINRSVNRPYLNRAFAFAMRNRNLYCLFLPCGRGEDGQLVENCNRAYIYNYVEKHWTIWQLSHEMTCHGIYHLSEAPTWEDLLDPLENSTARGTIESTDNSYVEMTDITGIEINNVIECATSGVLDSDTIVTNIIGATVYLSKAPLSTATAAVFHFYKSWRNMKMRWEDLILYEDDERHILGDVDGNIYEVSDRYFEDAGTPFSALFITKDFALSGDPKQNFKLVETVIGICDEHFDEEDQAVHSFAISASLDFGRNWTAEIIVNIESEELDEHSGTNYVEQIVNWIERGRQVRFKIRNINGSYFRIESLNIGFNASGVLKTNYN